MSNLVHKTPNKHLLKNRNVIQEISRHLWIESERVGHDVGFENAAEDWLIRFSSAWLKYHPPKRSVKLRIASHPKEIVAKRHASARKRTKLSKSY